MIGTFVPRVRRYGLALAAVACLGLGLPAAALAQRIDLSRDGRNSPKVLAAFRDVVAQARQSTVKVLCDGKETALGTVVGADGWVLTKKSELKGRTTCKLTDGRELEARTVGAQEAFDLALLKIDAKGLKPVEWADSKDAPVGYWVASAGTGRDPIGVGIVSVGVRKGNPKEAVPQRDLSRSGYLGVALLPAEEGEGAKIDRVEENSAAAKAGLEKNDVVLAVGSKPVKDVDEFIAVVGGHKPGDVITLTIRRGDEEKEVKATLGRRPPSLSRGDIQNTMGGNRLSARRFGFPSFLQHDTILKPEECGGPVVDLDGKAIGINIARAGRVESYAIPSEALRPVLAELMSKAAPKEIVSAKVKSAEEKLAEAKAALQRAEAEKTAAEKKVADARAAVEKAEAELNKEKASSAAK
jgi:serine protease Do